MLRFHRSRFGWILVLALGLWVLVAQAQEYRYHYVSLDQVELPSGFIFFDPVAINDSGQVYGNAYDNSFTPYVAVYANGTVTVLQPGIASSANAGGTIGGSKLLDLENYFTQAALFRGNQVELVPPRTDEYTSSVYDLNDSGTALVSSADDISYNETILLYKHGKTTALDFGPTVIYPFFLHINNQETISGTTYASGNGCGFRFDPRSGKTTQLNPLQTEPDAWALDINNRGDVLGYSFVDGGIERIGIWDRHAEFKTYFIEGTSEVPTISNRLVFNDNNLIVITNVSRPPSEKGNSYLVPKPDVRLRLADLVENLPSQQNTDYVIDINNHGDMIGYSIEDFNIKGIFLLERTGTKRAASSAAANTARMSSSDVENGRHAIPPVAAAILRRQMPPPYALKSGTTLPQGPLESLLLRLP